jgi:DNA-binding FrmR family transcriptional regulator
MPLAADVAGEEGGVTVELPDEVTEDLRLRLRRVGGQVRAVEQMLSEGRECRDIVTQLSAASNALEQVGFRLIASGVTYCVQHPEEAAESGYPLAEIQRLFTKLA